MPLIKAHEPLAPRPVIITFYGDPGIGKTTLINTAKNPITIDGELGIGRSKLRKDAIQPKNWEEVLQYEKEGLFKTYSTVAIDTPKSILDDHLMSYVVRVDPKLRGNKLWAYGAIGDEYKIFSNNRRQDQADLVNMCHSKKDEDTKRMLPDVTGQSLQYLLRISDMVGYYTIFNGRRMIFFDPSETTVGKNVAQLAPIEVPDVTNPAFRTFLADLIEQVRNAIASQSEEQLEAMQKSALFQEEIQQADTFERLDELYLEVSQLPDYLAIPLKKLIDDKKATSFTEAIAICDSPDMLTQILEKVNALSDTARIPLKKQIQEKGREKGYVANVTTKRFELAGGQPPSPPTTSPAARATAPAKPAPEFLSTSYDDRCLQFDRLGMTIELDRIIGFGLEFTHDEVGEWTEDIYLDQVVKVNEAKKGFDKNGKPKRATRAAAGAR